MAAGCSAIFMLDMKGKILIARNYRGDVPMTCAERFISKIMEEDEVNLRPVVEEDGITYIYIKSNNVYRTYRATTRWPAWCYPWSLLTLAVGSAGRDEPQRQRLDDSHVPVPHRRGAFTRSLAHTLARGPL